MSMLRLRALALSALLGLAGCGDATIPGTPGTPTPTRTVTPTPDTTRTPPATATATATATPGGAPSILPPICRTGRVVFSSATGEQCCVAVDPALLPTRSTPQQPGLILTDLPLGPATITIDGYTEDFAPAPPGITETCKTVNTTGVSPCDQTRNASAAYGSDPEEITIVGGVRVNLGAVEVMSLPFVLDYIPPQNTEVPLPVNMAFTVVDQSTGVARDSVGLEITLTVPQGEPPEFRPVTKRVQLELVACHDGTGQPCSPAGDLELAGFKARGVSEYLAYLPPGPVEARILAQNLADPPRDLDFRYTFVVAPEAMPTPAAIADVAACGETSGVLFVPTATPTATPEVP